MKPIDIIVEELDKYQDDWDELYGEFNNQNITLEEYSKKFKVLNKDFATNLYAKLPKLDRDSVMEIVIDIFQSAGSLNTEYVFNRFTDQILSLTPQQKEKK